MEKYIKYPFAENGNIKEIPNDTTEDGTVSFNQGYGTKYALNPKVDPNAKNIERTKMNYLFNILSSNIKQYQEIGFPEWIADKGDGNPFAYQKDVIVKYTDNKFYMSKVNSNTYLPTNATYWIEFKFELFQYLSGITSNVQTQIDGKQATINDYSLPIIKLDVSGATDIGANLVDTDLVIVNNKKSAVSRVFTYISSKLTGAISTVLTSNLTANKALLSDGSGKIAVSNITNTELGYLSGLSSNAQDQIDGKQATIADNGLAIAKLNVTGATDIGADLVGTDLIIVNNKKSAISRVWIYIKNLFSGYFGYVSVKDYGAVGDGITDDYQAFRDALNSNKNICIPEGDFYLASTLVVDRAVIIRGAGIGKTRLLKHSTNANNTCLDIKSSNTLFEDFEINIQSGSNVLTVGYGIRLFCDSVAYQSNRANRIKIQHQNFGIGIIETIISASPLNIIRPTKTYFDNIEVLDSNYIAIEVDGGNDTYFSNVLIDTSRGYGGVEAERGFGVLIKRTEGLWLDKIEALDSRIGILLSPSAGSYIKYVFVSDSAFDTNLDFGLAMDCYAGGELHSVNFNNCWFASNGAQPTEDGFGRGIRIDAGNGASDNLTQVSFNQCRIFNNGQHGVELQNCRNISFNNCEVAGNGNKELNKYDGIYVGNDVDNLRITSTYSAPTAGFTSTQRYGINLSSNTCTGAIVTSNFTSNNLTGGINNFGVTYSVIDNNIV